GSRSSRAASGSIPRPAAQAAHAARPRAGPARAGRPRAAASRAARGWRASGGTVASGRRRARALLLLSPEDRLRLFGRIVPLAQIFERGTAQQDAALRRLYPAGRDGLLDAHARLDAQPGVFLGRLPEPSGLLGVLAGVVEPEGVHDLRALARQPGVFFGRLPE